MYLSYDRCDVGALHTIAIGAIPEKASPVVRTPNTSFTHVVYIKIGSDRHKLLFSRPHQRGPHCVDVEGAVMLMNSPLIKTRLNPAIFKKFRNYDVIIMLAYNIYLSM